MEIGGRLPRAALGASASKHPRATPQRGSPGAYPDRDEGLALPDKWNRQVHYGWRYDPREREAARAERERQEALERAPECPGRQKAPKQKK